MTLLSTERARSILFRSLMTISMLSTYTLSPIVIVTYWFGLLVVLSDLPTTASLQLKTLQRNVSVSLLITDTYNFVTFRDWNIEILDAEKFSVHGSDLKSVINYRKFRTWQIFINCFEKSSCLNLQVKSYR